LIAETELKIIDVKAGGRRKETLLKRAEKTFHWPPSVNSFGTKHTTKLQIWTMRRGRKEAAVCQGQNYIGHLKLCAHHGKLFTSSESSHRGERLIMHKKGVSPEVKRELRK
jgi:hypothetical protein